MHVIIQGKTLNVEPAKFQMKGDAYDPKLKPKKLNKREKEKASKQKERLFAWVPDKMKVGYTLCLYTREDLGSVYSLHGYQPR